MRLLMVGTFLSFALSVFAVGALAPKAEKIPTVAPAVTTATNIRTESSKVILSDTSSFKIRNDTVRFVVYDTLKITKTMKDTSLVVKIDTVKSSSKPIPVK